MKPSAYTLESVRKPPFVGEAARTRRLALAKRAENVKLQAWLERPAIAPSEVSRYFRTFYQRVKSEIDCTECAACCRELPIPLKGDDGRRLARWLGQSTGDFYARQVRIRDHREVLAEVPCQFLTGTRCACYEARPEACRAFPYLDRMPSRLRRVVDDAETCPLVYHVLEGLKRELGHRWRSG